MQIRFTKMHGLGNDFVVLDAVSQNLRMTEEMARHLADRRFGIGCDQVLVVEPPSSPELDFDYRIFNADGSEVSQCGNGARCFAKFVRDQKLTSKSLIRVKTASGILELTIQGQHISVAMGVPKFQLEDIPFQPGATSSDSSQTTHYGPMQAHRLTIEGIVYPTALVSMGNPHAVLLVDDAQQAPVVELGKKIAQLPQFPDGVNVGFMAVRSRREINLRVYERGAGETLACGSGACAAVVAGQLQDLLDSEVTVNLKGGQLTIQWAGDGQPVIMTGPASTVYHGRMYYEVKNHTPK